MLICLFVDTTDLVKKIVTDSHVEVEIKYYRKLDDQFEHLQPEEIRM